MALLHFQFSCSKTVKAVTCDSFSVLFVFLLSKLVKRFDSISTPFDFLVYCRQANWQKQA